MPLLHIYIGTKQLRVEHDTTIQKGKKGTDGAFGQTEGFFRGPGGTLKFNKLNYVETSALSQNLETRL